MPRMTTSPDIEQRARALLDKRIDSVRTLVRTRQQLTELRGRLAAAERDDTQAYNAVLTDGWSADELRKLGLPAPEKKTRTRKPNTAKTTTTLEQQLAS